MDSEKNHYIKAQKGLEEAFKKDLKGLFIEVFIEKEGRVVSNLLLNANIAIDIDYSFYSHLVHSGICSEEHVVAKRGHEKLVGNLVNEEKLRQVFMSTPELPKDGYKNLIETSKAFFVEQ